MSMSYCLTALGIMQLSVTASESGRDTQPYFAISRLLDLYNSQLFLGWVR
jgi:hypothetical protein